MLKLFSKFRPIDWVMIVVLVGITIGQVYFDVHLPDHTAEIIRRTTDPMQSYGTGDILRAGGTMMLYSAGSLGASLIASIIAAFLAAKLGAIIRSYIFGKVQAFGFEETNKFSTASLITRSTNDIGQVQTVTMMLLRIAISAPVTAIWAIIRINQASWELTLTTALAILSLIVILLIMCIFVIPKFKHIQKLTDKLNGAARENLTGIRVVKAYNADKYEEEKFGKVNQELNRTQMFTNRIMGLAWPLLMLIMQGVNLAIFWIGAHLVSGGYVTVVTNIVNYVAYHEVIFYGALTFPDLMQFSGLALQILMSFLMISFLIVMVPRAQVSATRIREVLNTNAKITDPENPKGFVLGQEGRVVFDNVSFRYPDAEANVLEGISFEVERGQTAAFIGSTGSGKSTLINLVPRFYDISEGSVKVGGVDVKDVSLFDLRGQIGYVPQKGVLFGGTVKSNMAYGIEGEEENVQEIIEKASHIAMAEEFVEGLDDKYEAKVSQGGKNFSGGQKQRMSIARAVAARPNILIFDDSFSALDYKTDREVRARLREHTRDTTCLIVAQRIGTIMEADVIVVLEEGKMVGKGTHRELLDTCDVYKEIALSQLSEEELSR